MEAETEMHSKTLRTVRKQRSKKSSIKEKKLVER